MPSARKVWSSEKRKSKFGRSWPGAANLFGELPPNAGKQKERTKTVKPRRRRFLELCFIEKWAAILSRSVAKMPVSSELSGKTIVLKFRFPTYKANATHTWKNGTTSDLRNPRW